MSQSLLLEEGMAEHMAFVRGVFIVGLGRRAPGWTSCAATCWAKTRRDSYGRT